MGEQIKKLYKFKFWNLNYLKLRILAYTIGNKIHLINTNYLDLKINAKQDSYTKFKTYGPYVKFLDSKFECAIIQGGFDYIEYKNEFAFIKNLNSKTIRECKIIDEKCQCMNKTRRMFILI